MRDIRFRAWDRKKKTLFPVHELEFHKISHDLTKCVGYDDWDKDGYTMHGGGIMKYANEERYILMQYTGLTDQDGRDMYEGDLYKIEDNWPVYEVVWNEKYGCFGLQGRGPFYDFKTIEDRRYVIHCLGNKFEHPELLEG